MPENSILVEIIEKLQWINDICEGVDPQRIELYGRILNCIEDYETRDLLSQHSFLDVVDSQTLLVMFDTIKSMRRFSNLQIVLRDAFRNFYGLPVEVKFYSYEALEAEYIPQPTSIALTKDQDRAVNALLNFMQGKETLFRLCGYAGTGKSFLICQFFQYLCSQQITFVAACPTNKAAKNLRQIAEAAGLALEVKTVAQLLGQQPELNEETGREEFRSNGSTYFANHRVIVIDEFSMVARENFQEIVTEARSHGCKVVFVGDNAQLPPINEKEPMAATYSMNQAVLSEVVRYDGDLARIAEAVRSNPIIPHFTTTADKTVVCLPEKEWLARAFEAIDSEEFDADADYCRFLAWRNKTVNALNDAVRLHLWGEEAAPFVPGDRLIARKPLFRPKPGAKGKNKWGIFINNSEEAIVVEAGKISELKFAKDIYKYWEVGVRTEMSSKQAKLLILHEDSKDLHTRRVKDFASKKQWSSYFDLSRMFDDVGYGYALTVHKAQGSSINKVFLDLEDIRRSPDRQKLLYTALTRAKEAVFVLN